MFSIKTVRYYEQLKEALENQADFGKLVHTQEKGERE